MTSISYAEASEQLTAPGQVFEMEEVAIRGVPTRTWKSAPKALREVLSLTVFHGDKTFLVYEDERTTFKEHYDIAVNLGHRLIEEYGVKPGDRVAIIMRNLPEWVEAFWAVHAVGAVVVPINAWWTGPELEYGLSDSGSKVAFVDTDRLERIRPHLAALPDLKGVVVTSEDRKELSSEQIAHVKVTPFNDFLGTVKEDLPMPDGEVGAEDDATIFYTSGTTGQPKGAVGTQRNMATNLLTLYFLNTAAGLRGQGQLTDISGKIQSAYLLSVPLFHATGCHAILMSNTAAGSKLVMMHHWDPERALELIEREQVTAFGGVPTMVMQVLDSPNFEKTDTSSVKSLSYGGAPAPPDLVRRIEEHFPKGSSSQGYGLTETSAVATMNSGADYAAKPDSCGPTVPVCDIAIVPEDFVGNEPTADLPKGADVTGELWIKGPNVVRGYWNKPEATAAAFSNGWFRTGDIARIDDEGFVFIVDRAKDMIIRGGENVYSVLVEAALFEHPAVSDCAVIGVPHEVLGEEVGAVIVLRRGHSVDAEELARHVRERLASFNVPAHFWFRSEPLPRNPQGKVLKRELRAELVSVHPKAKTPADQIG